MKAYGKKTPVGFEDDRAFAPKSSAKNEIKKGGDFKNSISSLNVKSKIRRIFKKKQRKENKEVINKELKTIALDHEQDLLDMDEYEAFLDWYYE